MSDIPRITLHSRFNRIMAVGVAVAAVLMVTATALSGDPHLVWGYPAAALLVFLAWAGLWRPFVRVDDDGVTLQNVSHRVLVPWAALIQVDTRYALTLVTPRGKFAAWAAPAPGVLAGALAGRRAANRETRAAGGNVRPSDLLGTDSGNAATVVREQWRARVERGAVNAGVADETMVRRHGDAVILIVGAALVALTAWALAASA